nr:MAG TPA: nucelotide kinase [Caudoviricetes sp.]
MDLVNVSGFRAPDLLENAKIKEAVKHPKHYQGIKGLEVFTVMENFIPKYEDSFDGYLAGNILKYVLRAPSKGKMLEDLKKAKEHLDLLIERLED